MKSRSAKRNLSATPQHSLLQVPHNRVGAIGSGRLPRTSSLLRTASHRSLLRSESTLSVQSYYNNVPQADSRPGTPILTPRTKFFYSPDIVYQSTEHQLEKVESSSSLASYNANLKGRPLSCISSHEIEDNIPEVDEEHLPTESEHRKVEFENYFATNSPEEEQVDQLVTVTEEEEEESEFQEETQHGHTGNNLNVTDIDLPLVEGEKLILLTKLPNHNLSSKRSSPDGHNNASQTTNIVLTNLVRDTFGSITSKRESLG